MQAPKHSVSYNEKDSSLVIPPTLIFKFSSNLYTIKSDPLNQQGVVVQIPIQFFPTFFKLNI